MDPDALLRLSALPGTRIELQRLSAALGSSDAALGLDVAMNESGICSTDLSGVRVLHLATHAFTSEEGRDAERAEPGVHPPARATPSDDGYLAASESLPVSHWPVFDDVARVMTVEALKVSAAGTPRTEALQAAQRKMREDLALDAAHSAVWAPFSLVGEGR